MRADRNQHTRSTRLVPRRALQVGHRKSLRAGTCRGRRSARAARRRQRAHARPSSFGCRAVLLDFLACTRSPGVSCDASWHAPLWGTLRAHPHAPCTRTATRMGAARPPLHLQRCICIRLNAALHRWIGMCRRRVDIVEIHRPQRHPTRRIAQLKLIRSTALNYTQRSVTLLHVST